MDRPNLLRAAAIVALVVVVVTALVAIHQRPAASVAENPSTTAPEPDDLSAELRRCSALGPKDTDDSHCVAVWEENRRRFFGGPPRPLPPSASRSAAPPATNLLEDAR